jgi:hypothetical protein
VYCGGQCKTQLDLFGGSNRNDVLGQRLSTYLNIWETQQEITAELGKQRFGGFFSLGSLKVFL